jgi:RNA polymerase sigma-70 factor (ECF subfamily)
MWPSPVVMLNRVVALGFRDGAQAGLDALQPLLDDPDIASYGYVQATRADFLRRLERWPEAEVAYREAMTLTDNHAEQRYLQRRLDEVCAFSTKNGTGAGPIP